MPESHRRALFALRSNVDDAFDPALPDGTALVMLAANKAPRVLFAPRTRIVDELLESAELSHSQAMKELAAQLLVRAPARTDRYYCVITDERGASVVELERPGDEPGDQLERAREAIAAHCLTERGLLLAADAAHQRFAVRSHGCSLCTSWAIALEERGVDVAHYTAPNAGKSSAQSARSTHVCDACLREQRAVRTIGRERFGIDERHAIEAMMPRPVLARLMHLLRESPSR